MLPVSPSHPPLVVRQGKQKWGRNASGLAQLIERQGATLAPLPGQPPTHDQALGQGLAASFLPLLSPQPRARQSLPGKET